MKESDTKKKASFVETHADGKNIQKECLVDLQTGKIEVGGLKIDGLKYDVNSPVVESRVEFRGKEYEIISEKIGNKTNYEIAHIGAFIQATYAPKTITEQKAENINPRWKPKNN